MPHQDYLDLLVTATLALVTLLFVLAGVGVVATWIGDWKAWVKAHKEKRHALRDRN